MATGFGGGTGTEADPYLITNASELAYLSSTTTEENSNYEGVYFALTTDIDLNCTTTQLWNPIGKCSNGTDDWFSGVFYGNNHSITNMLFNCQGTSNYHGLFGYLRGEAQIHDLSVYYANVTTIIYDEDCGGLVGQIGTFGSTANDNVVIKNCSVYNFTARVDSATNCGGLVGNINGSPTIDNCLVDNVNISPYSGSIYCGGFVGNINNGCRIVNSICSNLTLRGNIAGGLVGNSANTASGTLMVENCKVLNCNITSSTYVGGVVGICYCELEVRKTSVVGTTITSTGTTSVARAGGICGQTDTSSSSVSNIDIQDCYVDATIKAQYYIAGLFATYSKSSCGSIILMNNLIQGTLIQARNNTDAKYKGGLTPFEIASSSSVMNNIVNMTFSLYSSSSKYNATATGNTTNYYNSELSHVGVAASTDGARTESQLKDASSYVDWVDFDSHWIINDNINNGFPFPRAALSVAKITGFDGSGTQSDPYQIKTTADLQGMQAYYNDYQLIDECWWKLVNSINIATDSNGLTINWCPIGYEGGVISGFNGHFDGNGKTVSGLTITEQYENVGLFGKVASNATITNLNVTGTISWDQAKYVGGVVGLMKDGAMLTGCTYTGTITGYLNSGNHAIIGGLAGKYSTDAITGSANYDNYVYGANNYTTFTRFTATYTA